MRVQRRLSISATIIAVSVFAVAMRMLYDTRPEPMQEAVIGTLGQVDGVQHTITVLTPMGVETLGLSTSVRVHQGARSLPLGELASHRDERVKVWYRQRAGRRMATEVRLAAPGPDTAKVEDGMR